MEIQQLDILLRLIIAHLLADFVFQTDKLAAAKKNGLGSWHFYFHVFLVGFLTYVLLAQWGNFLGPIIIMSIHGLIDWLKIRIKSDGALLYLSDQFLHILTLVLYWILTTSNSILTILDLLKEIVFTEQALMVIIAYLTVSIPFGVLIGYLTQRWQKELDIDEKESLTNAGKWIGIIERILILTFILSNTWRPIGFLLAAKSIFRFGDLQGEHDRKKTEYILIGTLLSFTFSIILGIFIRRIFGSAL